MQKKDFKGDVSMERRLRVKGLLFLQRTWVYLVPKTHKDPLLISQGIFVYMGDTNSHRYAHIQVCVCVCVCVCGDTVPKSPRSISYIFFHYE